ncbi:MAG: hypothetical protein ABW276_12495 [Casimicrobiaceae bacterium]
MLPLRIVAACLVSLCVAVDARAASSMSYSVSVSGAVVDSDTRTFGGSGWIDVSRSGNNYDVRVEGGAYPATAGATVQASAAVPAQARVTAVSDGNFTLLPPAGFSSFAPVVGGRVVLYFRLAGDIVGSAAVAGNANVQMQTLAGPVNDSASVALANQPGPDSAEFEIALAFPPGFTAQDFVLLATKLTLDVSASVPGGALMTSSAGARDAFRVAGFRVFNAAGVQVTGFSMAPNGAIAELAPVPIGAARAIEYYNASYGLYFVTSLPLEIADLDSGKTPGWQRTGESFDVYASAGSGRAAVCRFYGVFGLKSSHFYAPRGLGCEALLPTNPVWQYEGEVFFTFLPDANGGCPAGNVPVYRLYNNGQGGAPNHRFTTSAAIQAQMQAEGWVPEGTGSGVGMCSPKP